VYIFETYIIKNQNTHKEKLNLWRQMSIMGADFEALQLQFSIATPALSNLQGHMFDLAAKQPKKKCQ
jgi:hypothetical protein